MTGTSTASAPALRRVDGRGAGADPGRLVVGLPEIFYIAWLTAHVTGQLGGRAGSLDVAVDVH